MLQYIISLPSIPHVLLLKIKLKTLIADQVYDDHTFFSAFLEDFSMFYRSTEFQDYE